MEFMKNELNLDIQSILADLEKISALKPEISSPIFDGIKVIEASVKRIGNSVERTSPKSIDSRLYSRMSPSSDRYRSKLLTPVTRRSPSTRLNNVTPSQNKGSRPTSSRFKRR
jgi:hypothetical protein